MNDIKSKTLKDYICSYNVFNIACIYATGTTDIISRKIIEAEPYHIAFEKEKHYRILYIDDIYNPVIKQKIVTEQELKEQCDKLYKLMLSLHN